ncbi:hypothetical protein QJS10_CPA05g00765 [Acorus calamus]|uniref:Bifunctional inhibitor/plant lipid transfer protein/seed storage helical domain-containing protein n=1 Tax=Acorus calamus TaxID=4465 RepID=A0AAV9ERX6_ACOCL|nr:hypothetical protein QJS10_CPA05g00765 [Acorus calamus]
MVAIVNNKSLFMVLTLLAVASAQECSFDVASGLLNVCGQYVVKGAPRSTPSDACCAAARKEDMTCVCRYMKKEEEEIISPRKVVYVAEYCHRPIPHGTKCGSFIVPNA